MTSNNLEELIEQEYGTDLNDSDQDTSDTTDNSDTIPQSLEDEFVGDDADYGQGIKLKRD